MAMPMGITLRDSIVNLDHNEFTQMKGLTDLVSIRMPTVPIVRREVTTMEAIVLTVLVLTAMKVVNNVLTVLVSTAMKVVNNVLTVLVSIATKVVNSVHTVLVSIATKVVNSVHTVLVSIKTMGDIIMASVFTALVTTVKEASSALSAHVRMVADAMESLRVAPCSVR
jgi:hypothetical protein